MSGQQPLAPPVGVMPRWRSEELGVEPSVRRLSILAAMKRYQAANKLIPTAWTDELVLLELEP